MKLKSKLFTSAVAFSMVLSMIAIPASAQTTAELTAQINSLLAMIAQLQAQIAGGGMTTTTTTTFTTDLTVGSTGSEVSALQQWLVSKGFLTMPAGVAFGYFGNLTKAAVAAYQASAGITPAVGYFGPITRAKVNVGSTTTTTTTTTTTVGCVAGATYSSVTGALCVTTTSGTITTPGVEGTLSVTQNNSGIASTVYEGDDMVAILGFDVEAKTSDIAVQRIKLDLDESTGSDTKFFNKIFSKLYVTEGGNILASIDLNSNTVVKDGSDYFITITGFNLVVPKNTKKQIVIKADLYSSIDSSDAALTYSIAFPSGGNGVRGVDGAGIDQYAGASTVTRSPDISASLSESATLKLSLNTSSPKKNDVVASAGAAEDELDNLTVLVFDAKAEKDEVTITDLVIRVAKTGTGAATASTSVRIFDGSTELDSVSMAIGAATFTDLDLVIPKDTTKTLTVKVDVRAANATIANFVTSVTAADSTDENSQGDSVTTTGTATGNSLGIRSAGPEITLLSKSISTEEAPQGSQLTGATSTLTASFSIKVKAVGADLLLGTIGSTTPMFQFSGASTDSFVVYRNGVAVTTLSNSTSTSYTVPSTCVADTANKACTLAEGSEVTIPITYLIQGRVASVGTAATAGLYAVGLEKINWGNAQTSTFMASETDWRTADVSFP